MTSRLVRYESDLNSTVKKTSINHNSRSHLHKMSKTDIENHYSKYFGEQTNIDAHVNLNNEFEQIENEDLIMYEKWLMESD